jgi:hypothetical protein
MREKHDIRIISDSKITKVARVYICIEKIV